MFVEEQQIEMESKSLPPEVLQEIVASRTEPERVIRNRRRETVRIPESPRSK